METFAPTFFSFLFKASIILLPFMVITKILRNLYIDKTINAYITLPDERMERIIHIYRSAISMWRIFLWAMPFFFLLILALFVLLFIYPELASEVPGVDIHQLVTLMAIFWVVGYIHILEDSYYKKKLLKAIDKSTGREMS
jgi:hypothetical protein